MRLQLWTVELGCPRDTGLLQLPGRQWPHGPRHLGCTSETSGGTSASLSPAPSSVFLGQDETPEDRRVGLKRLSPQAAPPLSALLWVCADTHLPRDVLSASLPPVLSHVCAGPSRKEREWCGPGVDSCVGRDGAFRQRLVAVVTAWGRLADADTTQSFLLGEYRLSTASGPTPAFRGFC